MHPARARTRVFVAAAFVAALVPPAARAADRLPVVFVAEVDAVIHPVSSEFMLEVMDRADTAGAAAVVRPKGGARATFSRDQRVNVEGASESGRARRSSPSPGPPPQRRR